MSRILLRGSLLASFFIYSLSIPAFSSKAALATNNASELITQSKELALHEHLLWQAILHVKNGQPINPSYDRYLSANDFSLEQEMTLTIELIVNETHRICNYPARVRFLSDFLAFNNAAALSHCADYQEYLKKVPITDIYLVYASENVKTASSMLGHIMLRMDGINDEGLEVSHGITFFTELEGFNIPKILYDSLVTGKKGFFQIAPYSNFVNNYLNVELRNVWEYKLSLSDIQKQLIKDIAWELGSADLSYFFHTYNCATVTQLLIASAVPEKIPNLQAWLTPLDVVRFVEENNLVEQTRLIPSDEWELRALIDSLSSIVIAKAKGSVQTSNVSFDGNLSEQDKLLTIAFYQSYNNFAKNDGLINDTVFNKNNQRIERLATTLPNYQLEVTEYKKPTDASLDGQFSTGWRRENEKNWMEIELFPVASDEGDNKKHVFGETTLKLASFDIWYDPESNNLKLDSFIVYSMNSRIPFESVFKSYSTGFQFGLERHHDDQLTRKLSGFVEGQFGRTYELNNDMGVYAEVALGLATDINVTYFYTTPKLGAYVYLLGDIKLRAQHSINFNKQKSDTLLKVTSFFLDWQIKDNLYLSTDFTKHHNSFKSVDSYGVSLRFRF